MKTLQGTGQQVCHVMIREVAKAAAGQLYESMMGDNDFFAKWKKQNPGLNAKKLERRFIEQQWPHCIEFARATLTIMLTKKEVGDAMKDEIMLALEQDYSLRKMAAPNTQLH